MLHPTRRRSGPSVGLHLLFQIFISVVIIGLSSAQLNDQQQADFEIWRAILTEPGPREPAVRRAAARRLMESGWPEAVSLLGKALQDHARPDVITAVCAALRETDEPPYALLDTLLDGLAAAPCELVPTLADAVGAYPSSIIPRLVAILSNPAGPDEGQHRNRHIAAIEALSRFVEVEVVDELIARLDSASDTEVRAAARRALARVTGVDQGESASRWQAWWRNNRFRGREGLLLRRIHTLEIERTDTRGQVQSLERLRELLVTELRAAHMRIYVLTESGQRNAMIASLLQHQRPSLRSLALDLVEQRVLNAEPVSAEVKAGVEHLLSDEVASVRAAAVRRLALLDPQRTAELVAPRLGVEKDSEVEQAILAVMAQSPLAEAVDAVIASLARPDRPRGAVAAALSACRHELLSDNVRHLAADAILQRSDGTFSAAEAELLGCCGSPSALQRLETLLGASEISSEVKAAAARGLAQTPSPSARDILVQFAADPAVYPSAVEFISREGGLDALQTILAWRAHNPTAFLEAADRIIRALPPGDWLEADRLVAAHGAIGPDRRIAWLSRVMTLSDSADGRGNNAPGNNPLGAAQRRSLCVRLAELHLKQGSPEDVLAALDAAGPAGTDERIIRLRSASLIALGRFDDLPTNGDPTTWLTGLDLLLRMPQVDHGRAVRLADLIRDRHSDDFTADQRRHFDELAAKVAALDQASDG